MEGRRPELTVLEIDWVWSDNENCSLVSCYHGSVALVGVVFAPPVQVHWFSGVRQQRCIQSRSEANEGIRNGEQSLACGQEELP